MALIVSAYLPACPPSPLLLTASSDLRTENEALLILVPQAQYAVQLVTW